MKSEKPNEPKTVFETHCEQLTKLLAMSNPPSEDDLGIAELIFTDKDGKTTRIEATGCNRMGRLFIQHLAQSPFMTKSSVLIWDDERMSKAANFFAERWLDRHTAGRKMLIAMSTAVRVEVIWKDGPFAPMRVPE